MTQMPALGTFRTHILLEPHHHSTLQVVCAEGAGHLDEFVKEVHL